jgi:hypothetical protein
VLEIWIHERREDLDGETLLAMMRDEEGRSRLRDVVAAIVAAGDTFGQ